MQQRLCSVLFFALIYTLIFTNQIPAEEWLLPITISTSGHNFRLNLGIHPQATDEYDTGLDTLAPPPAFTPYSALWITDFPNTLQTDRRGEKDTTRWTIKMYNLQEAATIAWDTSISDILGQLYIQNINMKEQDSLSIQTTSLSVTHIRDNTAVNQTMPVTPVSFRIYNTPNPFSTSTTIHVQLQRQPFVLRIFDLKGRLVYQTERKHSNAVMRWHGQDQHGQRLPGGVYLCRVTSPSGTFGSKLLLVR